jgi:N-acetylglucosamine kinase-like BadF-type ATPase
MGSVNLFLAVDGGNSKTEVLLADTSGAVLGFARGPGSNHQTAGGLDVAMSRVDSLVHEVRTQAGLSPDVRPVLAALYLAGADFPVEYELLNDAITAADWAEKSIMDNDTFALLRAGTESPDAVAVICGAGTNCVARAADGRTIRFPSLGTLSGDWGGGGHLSQLAIWHAARAEDGRGAPTALVEAITRFLGYPTIAKVSEAAHLGTLSPDDITNLTPVLFEAAAAGDQIAQSLITRQGEEVVTIATTALRRLDLLTTPVAVVLGGGVLRTRDPLLFNVITGGLAATAPHATLTVVTDPPVVGAALLALDALGIDGPAHPRLRTEVARLASRGGW